MKALTLIAVLILTWTLSGCATQDFVRETVAPVQTQVGDLSQRMTAQDEGLKALAKLRLAGVLMDQKNYDEALKQLSSSFAPEFSSVVADRKGDVLMLQGKRQDAIAEYTKAYKGFEDSVEYRRLVEIKLNALGVSLQGVNVASAVSSTATPAESK